jgi:hypothetical protein
MRTAIILLLACAAGCGAERVLESGAYLCTTSHDCGYGWTCAESPTLHKKVCFAPEDAPDAGAADVGVADAPVIEDGPALPDATAGWVVGVRWTQFLLNKPTAISTVANLQLPQYVQDGTIIILLAVWPTTDGIGIVGGGGSRVSASPLTYAITPDMVPPTVHGVEATSVSANIFSTNEAFAWSLEFLPGQPPLDVRRASLGGTLDANGVPTSASPALAGFLRGCITRASAEAINISALSSTLGELLDSNGAVYDCATIVGGAVDGYALDVSWQADEIVRLVTASPGG